MIDRLMERKTAEHLQGLIDRSIDISAPLKAKDLLTQTGLLKATHRWGVWKALFLFWLLMTAGIVGVLLILGLWLGWIGLGWMSADFIVGYTFSSTIPITTMYYRTISKAIRSIEKSKESENREVFP